jgi:hypothetical protein
MLGPDEVRLPAQYCSRPPSVRRGLGYQWGGQSGQNGGRSESISSIRRVWRIGRLPGALGPDRGPEGRYGNGASCSLLKPVCPD